MTNCRILNLIQDAAVLLSGEILSTEHKYTKIKREKQLMAKAGMNRKEAYLT
jgi:hypothetical protein